MTDKTVVVSNTGFVNTNDLLISTGTADAFDVVLANVGNARGLKQDASGVKFIQDKYDELTVFINTRLPGIPTLDEVKPVIQEWIDKQTAEVVHNA